MSMEFFTVLPMWNYSSKQITITDSKNVQVGYIQRKYKSLRENLIHYSPLSLSFLETIHIDGEDKDNRLEIREQSFKSNLKKLKWDIFLNDPAKENKFLLEDKTKISTNPRMAYHKNKQKYVFKKDPFNRTCEVTLNDHSCVTIRIDKKIPPSLRTVMDTGDLTIIELLGIYYVINLTY